MLGWAGMLILLSHRLTLKGPIPDCGSSSIMCSYTGTNTKNTIWVCCTAPRWQSAEYLWTEARWCWKKKHAKKKIHVFLLYHYIYFPPFMFIFRGLFTDRAVTVCYRKHSKHQRWKQQGITLKSSGLCVHVCAWAWEDLSSAFIQVGFHFRQSWWQDDRVLEITSKYLFQ